MTKGVNLVEWSVFTHYDLSPKNGQTWKYGALKSKEQMSPASPVFNAAESVTLSFKTSVRSLSNNNHLNTGP